MASINAPVEAKEFFETPKGELLEVIFYLRDFLVQSEKTELITDVLNGRTEQKQSSVVALTLRVNGIGDLYPRIVGASIQHLKGVKSIKFRVLDPQNKVCPFVVPCADVLEIRNAVGEILYEKPIEEGMLAARQAIQSASGDSLRLAA